MDEKTQTSFLMKGGSYLKQRENVFVWPEEQSRGPVLFTVTTSPGHNPIHCKSHGACTKPLVHFHMLHTCMGKFSISQV